MVVRFNCRPSCKGISWKLEKVDTEECGVPIYASSQAFLCFCSRVKGMGVRVIKNWNKKLEPGAKLKVFALLILGRNVTLKLFQSCQLGGLIYNLNTQWWYRSMQIITRDHRLHTVPACKSESSLWKHLLGAKFVQVISCHNRNLGIRYKKQFPVFHLSDTKGKCLKSRKFQRIKDIFIKLDHILFEPSCSSSAVLRVNYSFS